MDIKDIHEKVFQFLLTKRDTDPSLRYSLRYQDDEKMKKGYWFHGTETSLYITFWDEWGNNSEVRQKNPVIFFSINQDGSTKLEIDERRKNVRSSIWEFLAPALALTSNSEKTKWWKEYPKNMSYIESLGYFIYKERPYINSYLELKGYVTDYPTFAEGKFLRNLNKIVSIREGFKQIEFDAFLKQKLIVNCLQLSYINVFESLNISFDKQVTCFVGGNGSGKTTILRAIALGLVGSKGFKADELNLLAIKETKKNKRFHEKGVIDVFYTYEGQNLNNSIEFKSDKEQAEAYLLEDKGFTLRDETEDKRLKTLIIGFSQQVQSDKETKTNGGFNPKISDIEALIFNKVDNRYKEFIKWLSDLITANAKEDREHNKKIVDSVFNIINDITGDSIALTSDTDTYVKTNRNPNGIPMDLLSQGYRNVLAWLGFFMKRMVEYQESLPMEIPNFTELPAICLIDEIDTYLHPDWQYTILSGLVNHFPNVQFFITSHSPFVLTSVESDKISIFELTTEQGQVFAREKEVNLYGADANRATESISTERKSNIQEAFENLDEAIENNNLEEAQNILDSKDLTEIDPHLDLGILRAKRLIRTKQLLKKAKEEAAK